MFGYAPPSISKPMSILIPFFIYAIQFISHYIFYIKNTLKKLEALYNICPASAFIGLAFLLTAIFNKTSQFRLTFRDDYAWAGLALFSSFIFLCWLTVWIYKIQSKNLRNWRRNCLWSFPGYYIASTVLIISIRVS